MGASPAPAANAAVPPHTVSTTTASEERLVTSKPSFVPASKRTDLPPRVVVTKVDVEAKKWQPGVGRIMKGTSRDWVERPAEKGKEAGGSGGDGEGEWKGWMTAEEVEKRWDSLRKVGRTQVHPGMRVATQVRLFSRLSEGATRYLTCL
jgi:hypothetical protein